MSTGLGDISRTENPRCYWESLKFPPSHSCEDKAQQRGGCIKKSHPPFSAYGRSNAQVQTAIRVPVQINSLLRSIQQIKQTLSQNRVVLKTKLFTSSAQVRQTGLRARGANVRDLYRGDYRSLDTNSRHSIFAIWTYRANCKLKSLP